MYVPIIKVIFLKDTTQTHNYQEDYQTLSIKNNSGSLVYFSIQRYNLVDIFLVILHL